jgi:small conductance mechanosensitive channel
MLESAATVGAGGAIRVGWLDSAFGVALERVARDLAAVAAGVLQAALAFAVAVVLARVLRQRVLGALQRARVDPNAATLAANGVLIGVYALGVAVALSLVGGNWSAVVAVLGASTVAVSLAMQDVLRSFVAGVYLLLERPFVIGDRIEVKGVEGSVVSIDLRTTTLRTDAAGLVYVPNATVFSEIVRNRSVGIANGTTVTLTGVAGDLGELPNRLRDALAALAADAGDPRIDKLSVGPTGADATFSIAHDRSRELAPEIAARLRAAFPEATVAVERSAP